MEAFIDKTTPDSGKHTHTNIYVHILHEKLSFLLGKLARNSKSAGQPILLIPVIMNLTAAKPPTSDTWLHPVLWKSCSGPGWTPWTNCFVCMCVGVDGGGEVINQE